MEEKEEKESEEEKKEVQLEGRKDKIIAGVKKWFDNPYNKALFGILLLALAIRLFYFFMVKQQPLWFDEAEYMAQAKRFAFGYDWYWKSSIRKPILMSFMFSLLYRIGFKEMGFRVLMLLVSVAAVYLTYLVAADFFDKKIGLIAAFLMSTWWVHLFFTVRLLTWLPASALLLLATHFFYKGYVKKEGPRNIWWFGVFFALAFLMRVTAGVMIIPFFLYVVMEEKWRFLKNKNLWIALLLILLVVLPFFIWLLNTYSTGSAGSIGDVGSTIFIKFFGVRERFTFGTGGAMGLQGIPLYFKDFPNLLKTSFFLVFLIGSIIIIADLVLGFDLIFKKEYQKLRLKFFVLACILLPLIAFGMTRAYVEQRDAMAFSVFLFSLVGIGAMKLYDLIKKYNKIFAAAVVVALLLLGTYPQLTYGYGLIKSKKDSYAPVRDAGLWISQQANEPDDTIISVALPQVSYYSELSARGMPGEEEDMAKALVDNNAKYFLDSTFEPYWLIPEWSYTWGERHPEFATRVWAWFDNPQQPRQFVIVYEINQDALKNYLLELNKTAKSAENLNKTE